jgi:DNA-binding NarL/FixJ family response regulator
LRREPVIRIVLADDHHLVRQGIRALLDKADGVEVVGEAADGQEAIEQVVQLVPDVLVMDIAMPRLNGIQAIERVRSQGTGTQIVVLSMYSDGALVRQALRSGASGYLLKVSVTDELLLAVRAASRGDLYLSPAIARALLADVLAPSEDAKSLSPFDRLTPREREVLQLIAEGQTNTAIAQLLDVSIKTVEKHRANLMSKLGVHDLAGLIRMAIGLGLVFVDDLPRLDGAYAEPQQ